MKHKLFEIMGSLKLFTVSLVLALLASCGSDDTPTDEAGTEQNEEPEVIQGDQIIVPNADSTELKLLYGSWQLIQINEQAIQPGDALFGLKQTFMPDRTWFISTPSTSAQALSDLQKQEEDSVMLVEGGRWSFDINSRQLNILFTADSIHKTIMLTEINQQKMMVLTLEGVNQAWTKIVSKETGP